MPPMTPFASLPGTFPTLAAEDLVLREIVPSDAADWHRYLADPRVYEHTTSTIASLAEVEGLIELFRSGFVAKERIRWAIARSVDGQMIGDCGYNDFHERDLRGTIGYQLAPECWGQGLMTAALKAIIVYGFADLGLNKIEATVNVNNERSAKLLRRLGFQLEGTIRDYRNRRGVFGDSWFFGLLKREWPV